MDVDLTANAFRRFVRRRGLSRDRPDGTEGPSHDNYPNNASASGATSSGTSSYPHFESDVPPSHPLHQPPGHVPQLRASSTYVRPRNMHGLHHAGANYPHADSSVRRTQSQAEASMPQSPHRRPRRPDDDGSKKQYRCEYCNLQFGRKHHKERHVANIHRHEKPYVCDMCGHPFHQKPNLDRHRATVHAEVNPFRCEECGATFHRRNQLKNHMQTVHDRSRRQECTVCRLSFPGEHELNEHMRTQHSASVTRHARTTR